MLYNYDFDIFSITKRCNATALSAPMIHNYFLYFGTLKIDVHLIEIEYFIICFSMMKKIKLTINIKETAKTKI